MEPSAALEKAIVLRPECRAAAATIKAEAKAAATKTKPSAKPKPKPTLETKPMPQKRPVEDTHDGAPATATEDAADMPDVTLGKALDEMIGENAEGIKKTKSSKLTSQDAKGEDSQNFACENARRI